MSEPQTVDDAIALDDYAELVEEFRQARAARKRWEADEQMLSGKLLKLIGQAKVGTVGGLPVLAHVHTEPRFDLDKQRLKQWYPDLYQQFETKEVAGSDYLKPAL
jgi:hypothetical protein